MLSALTAAALFTRDLAPTEVGTFYPLCLALAWSLAALAHARRRARTPGAAASKALRRRRRKEAKLAGAGAEPARGQDAAAAWGRFGTNLSLWVFVPWFLYLVSEPAGAPWPETWLTLYLGSAIATRLGLFLGDGWAMLGLAGVPALVFGTMAIAYTEIGQGAGDLLLVVRIHAATALGLSLLSGVVKTARYGTGWVFGDEVHRQHVLARQLEKLEDMGS